MGILQSKILRKLFLVSDEGEIYIDSIPDSSLIDQIIRICPGKDLADSIIWITIAMSVALLDIAKARDQNGEEITPVADWSDGVIMYAMA